jgi:hypothetical protein
MTYISPQPERDSLGKNSHSHQGQSSNLSKPRRSTLKRRDRHASDAPRNILFPSAERDHVTLH